MELFENYQGGREHSLLSVIDHTASAMGGRLLKRWLGRPLSQSTLIEERQQAVAELIANKQDCQLQPLLKQFSDVERIVSRIALKSARPRCLVQLRQSLALLPEFKKLFLKIKVFRLTIWQNHFFPNRSWKIF